MTPFIVGSVIVILYFLALFAYGVDMLIKSCDTIGRIKSWGEK